MIIGESIDEFNTFKDSMFKVYQPFGAYEEEIFIKLVELLWRLRRVGVIETGIYGNEILEYDADTYKPKASNKITHSDFKKDDQNKVQKNQSLIGVAFTRDSNAGSSLLKLNTIEGRLIGRVQLFEDLLLKAQNRRRKGVRKWEKFLTLKSAIMGEIKGVFSQTHAIKVVAVSKQSQL